MPTAADQALQHFHTLLPQLEGGRLNEELTEALRKAVSEIADACADRGGVHKASVTLKLDFQMNQKDGFVEIEASITEKMPKATRGRAGIFFCDAHGNLTRENPKQMTFDEVAERRRERADIA